MCSIPGCFKRTATSRRSKRRQSEKYPSANIAKAIFRVEYLEEYSKL